MAGWLDRHSLYIALLAAWVATLGSLYFSEVAGYIPCTLCWYQRILMYPLALLLAVGLLRGDEHLPVLVLPFAVPGLGLALYHYLLEKTDLFSEGAVCTAGVSCTIPWINWFGFVTIPFLSLLGFLIITLMAIIAVNAGEPSPPEGAAPPFLTVAAIVVLCIVAYALLALWLNGNSGG
jgi:disulfide bond formation protein DsbB